MKNLWSDWGILFWGVVVLAAILLIAFRCSATSGVPPVLPPSSLMKPAPMISLLCRDGHTKIFVKETETGVTISIVNLTPRMK